MHQMDVPVHQRRKGLVAASRDKFGEQIVIGAFVHPILYVRLGRKGDKESRFDADRIVAVETIH